MKLLQASLGSSSFRISKDQFVFERISLNFSKLISLIAREGIFFLFYVSVACSRLSVSGDDRKSGCWTSGILYKKGVGEYSEHNPHHTDHI